eukprot:NODE_438_length_8605_cov_0.277334.p4 type:complete len:117 gc:universal NODE_438_length_8605_cov_0.277334:3877-3527(-)
MAVNSLAFSICDKPYKKMMKTDISNRRGFMHQTQKWHDGIDTLIYSHKVNYSGMLYISEITHRECLLIAKSMCKYSGYSTKYLFILNHVNCSIILRNCTIVRHRVASVLSSLCFQS